MRFLTGAGIDLVIGRGQGYHIWDVDGRELIDIHLNGGVYNLGHRNPDVIASLSTAAETLDIGNHHFPSTERAALAERLIGVTPGAHYAVFASGGGEAIDVAIKSARRATGRRRVVSVVDAYHGHTGLALAAGDEQAANAFLATEPDFVRVAFNDIDALDAALAEPTAAVILETVPATAGFPDRIRSICQPCASSATRPAPCTSPTRCRPASAAAGRCGRWTTSGGAGHPGHRQGPVGGIYPIAATLLSERAGAWIESDGWSHVSTFGGAELGCRVAATVLDLTERAMPDLPIQQWTEAFAGLQQKHPDWVVEVRQTGLIIGVKFAHEMGGMLMTKLLFDNGVWAMFAGFDRSVLQVKPGLLMGQADIDEVMAAFDRACTAAVAL